MYVRQKIVPNIGKVIDLFSTKNRRLTFTWNSIIKNVNILQTIPYVLILLILTY